MIRVRNSKSPLAGSSNTAAAGGRVRQIVVLALSLMCAPAFAGSGPWVVGTGQASLYVGTESQRITRLAITVDGERDVIDVDQGLTAFGLKGIASLGVTNRAELEVQLPWWTTRANRTDEPLCDALGQQACDTTSTVGVLAAKTKVLLLDEYFGSPLSLSVGAEFRYGDFTAPTRARLTNAGEGTTDLGPTVSIGRVGSFMGKGYFLGQTELGWRYRFPTTRNYPDFPNGKRAAPLPETWANAEFLVGSSSRFVVGPSFGFLYRDGLDWGELDLADPDRLAALNVVTARLGATAILHNDGNLALVGSVLQAVATKNNPNTLSVGIGVGFSGLARKSE